MATAASVRPGSHTTSALLLYASGQPPQLIQEIFGAAAFGDGFSQHRSAVPRHSRAFCRVQGRLFGIGIKGSDSFRAKAWP